MAFALGAATYPYLWDLPLEAALDRIAAQGLRGSPSWRPRTEGIPTGI